MKSTSILGLLVSLAAASGACSDATNVPVRTDPPVTVDPPVDSGHPEDAGTPDVVPPPKPVSCSDFVLEQSCPTTSPPPKGRAAISEFVKDTAAALRCRSAKAGEPAVWDLGPLIELYGDQKMFMVGEVHGQNEIGIVSSLLLEALASTNRVNVLGYEMPMDYESALQRYVDTGSDAQADAMLDGTAENFFGNLLTRSARTLATNGTSLRIAAVDLPYDPMFAVRAIRDVTKKLSSQRGSVESQIPASVGAPASSTEVATVQAFFDYVIQNEAAICAELSSDDCDRLVAMTHALWASALMYDDTAGPTTDLWFERREAVIYYNLRTHLAAQTDRMFLHMGAAHTNKGATASRGYQSAGGRMAHTYPLTKGQVFSIAPAYGNGSVTWYGQELELPGEPATIISSLTDSPPHPMFVSTTRPNDECVANPLATELEDNAGIPRAEAYDGYVHYGQLTSEMRPKDTSLDREADDGNRSFRTFRARIERKERAALAAKRARR